MLPVAPGLSLIVSGLLPDKKTAEELATSKSIPTSPAIVSVFAPDVVRVACVPLINRNCAIVSVGIALIAGEGLLAPSTTSTSATLMLAGVRVGVQLSGFV